MKWKAEFVGRKVGAIGTRHAITHEFESTDDPEQANLDLYKTHEHIGWLRLTNEHGVQFIRHSTANNMELQKRIITVKVHNIAEAEDAFSVIVQSLDNAEIVADVTIGYENADADSGTTRVPPEAE